MPVEVLFFRGQVQTGGGLSEDRCEGVARGQAAWGGAWGSGGEGRRRSGGSRVAQTHFTASYQTSSRTSDPPPQMHWKEAPAPHFRAPSLCPVTVSLTASASLNSICNRQ